MKSRRRKNLGQTITEYVLIIAVVVVAAISVLTIFSDTVRSKLAGAIAMFDGSDEAPTITGSEGELQDLGDDLQPNNGN